MRCGAIQVIHAPVRPDDLQDALDCIAEKRHDLSKLAQVIAVTGAVGGAGCSTVALNLAYELGVRTQTRHILMELALRCGSLANHLDISPRYTTSDLAADIRRIDSCILDAALTPISDNVSVVVGPYGTIPPHPIDVSDVMELIHLARGLAPRLLLDVPSTYDDLYFRSLAIADRIVIVADQTVTAIRAVQMICNTLSQRRPLVVVNRYSSKHSCVNVDRIRELLPGCDVCAIRDDPAVVQSMNQGKPLRLFSPRSPVLNDIRALIDALRIQSETAPPIESMLRRLGRTFAFTS